MQVSNKYIFTHRQCCCVYFKFKTKSNNSMNHVIDRMIDKYEIVKLTYEEKNLVVEDHKRFGTAYTCRALGISRNLCCTDLCL